jgi:uncharacterized protein YbbK (DUF523 family)
LLFVIGGHRVAVERGDWAASCPLRHELSEGLPVPREPAYAAERSQDGEAKAASE